MKPNSPSSSSRSAPKTDTCGTSSTTLATKPCDCDTSWNAYMPYPTWPFTRVLGAELVKREKLARSQSIDNAEEALL